MSHLPRLHSKYLSVITEHFCANSTGLNNAVENGHFWFGYHVEQKYRSYHPYCRSYTYVPNVSATIAVNATARYGIVKNMSQEATQ